MSASRSTGWPMRRSRSCVSLKFASTQISRQRANGHQALADLHIVAGIDIAARDHAVDFGDDIAIAQVQIGLIEIALALCRSLASACFKPGASLMISS